MTDDTGEARGELLEPQEFYGWPEVHAWPAAGADAAADPAAEAVYRLYASRGQDHAALEAVAERFWWRVHDPRLGAALRRRAADQAVSVAAVKRHALMYGLVVAVAEDAFREQAIRWGRNRWMYDGAGRRARVVPVELHHEHFRRWLRFRAISRATDYVLEDDYQDLDQLSPRARAGLWYLDVVPGASLEGLSPLERRLWDAKTANPDASRRDLAADLGTTPATVKSLLKRVRRKLRPA